MRSCCVPVLVLTALAVAVSAAKANSCSNMDVMGTWDQSGLRESSYGMSAVGTFRIAAEEDEAKQPMFNLSKIPISQKSD